MKPVHYTVELLSEPGTLIINGDRCRIIVGSDVVLIDNETRGQQFAAYAWIFENQVSETIFPSGFWQPGNTMRQDHGRWFNLGQIRLSDHPLALFAWHVERNRISPQQLESGDFYLDYPFYAIENA